MAENEEIKVDDDDEDILAKKAKKVLNKSSKKKAVLDFGEAERDYGG